jgi:hexosaminidase
MMMELVLLPQPRQIDLLEQAHVLRADRFILLDAPDPHTLRFAAQRFQAALQRVCGLQWSLFASPAVPPEVIGLTLRLNPDRVTHSQGYELTIGPEQISLEARDEAGVFYGVCTLIQILEGRAPAAPLPGLHIVDWPDFPVRGVMLDISRDRVPTLKTTCALIDRLASWKINQFQLYTEHTFAYLNHPEVWAKASPFTGEEILELDAYCRERHIELVPNQNSFGHMHRWFEHARYAPLAEAPDGFDFPWGDHSEGPFSLCPIDPGSLTLVTGLFDELLPHFTSKTFNVGCDETFDLGQGRSRAECDRLGTGRVYVDYLRKVYQAVTDRDHLMQFWGDIIVQYPELISELPRDAIALDWGYEANYPFDEHGAQFAQAGLPFYVCPGTSSWNSIGGRTDNALGNLRSAAENGLKHGASGYLNTDWGDNGHWQALPISELGFAMGAAYSWGWEANRMADVPRVVSQCVFDDPSGNLGRVAYDLGNVYQTLGFVPHNSSVLFWMLQWPLPQVTEGYRESVSAETLHAALAAIDHALAPLRETRSTRADVDLLRREFELAGWMLRHAAQRGLLAIGAPLGSARDLDRDLRAIMREYETVWLARNRPGGLSDSVARLAKRHEDYAAG